jgi:hypothetical protein
MGIFSKAPAAKERAAFDTAEQRLQAVADRLGQVQRDLAAARAALAALRPGDTLEDIEQAAQAFAAEHGRLQARVVFLQHARERLTADLAQARRAVIAAESAVGEALKQHFQTLADDRLKRLAGIVGEELELLACELARASGHHHARIDWNSVMGAIRNAIVSAGKLPQNFGVGLAYAESQTPKIPPPPRSALLTGDHRAGRDLDRLTPTIDAQAIRSNLKTLNSQLAEHQRALAMLGANPSADVRRAELQKLVNIAEQYRAELAQQLADAEEAQALAA